MIPPYFLNYKSRSKAGKDERTMAGTWAGAGAMAGAMAGEWAMAVAGEQRKEQSTAGKEND